MSKAARSTKCASAPDQVGVPASPMLSLLTPNKSFVTSRALDPVGVHAYYQDRNRSPRVQDPQPGWPAARAQIASTSSSERPSENVGQPTWRDKERKRPPSSLNTITLVFILRVIKRPQGAPGLRKNSASVSNSASARCPRTPKNSALIKRPRKLNRKVEVWIWERF